MKVSIKTGDTVLVNSGKDSGKKGKVLAIKESKKGVRVVVEGVNIVTKAKKARSAQDKSELVKIEAGIDVSNVNVVCPTCGKPTRVKHALVDGKKVRVCSCGAVLDKKFVKDSKTKITKTSEKSEKTEEPKKAVKKITATTEKKSKTTSKATNEKATKTAEAKKPTTARSSQRGV